MNAEATWYGGCRETSQNAQPPMHAEFPLRREFDDRPSSRHKRAHSMPIAHQSWTPRAVPIVCGALRPHVVPIGLALSGANCTPRLDSSWCAGTSCHSLRSDHGLANSRACPSNPSLDLISCILEANLLLLLETQRLRYPILEDDRLEIRRQPLHHGGCPDPLDVRRETLHTGRLDQHRVLDRGFSRLREDL